jgi:hypothetical protein
MRLALSVSALDELGRFVHHLRGPSDLLMTHFKIERIGCRHQPDDCEHDETNALLTVIRPMRERYAGAGQDQQGPHPPNRRLVSVWRLEELLLADKVLEQQESAECQRKTEQRRHEE